MRRLVRILGTLLIAAGLGTLAWAFVVWRWEDPFTGVYTRLEQRELASSYERRFDEFVPRASPASLADRRGRLRADAKLFRTSSRRGEAIGRLRIKRLGLNMIVVNGTDHRTLRRGPGRYLGSFMPGEGELVYVAGHRTTYLAPFSHIDRLRSGDRVIFELPYAAFEYRVTRSVVVEATALEVLRSRGRETLALQACHPRFFATHRLLVYAAPVRATPRGAGSQPIPAAALATSD
ncbi:MAG: sortase [Gaiellaceae bacterium]